MGTSDGRERRQALGTVQAVRRLQHRVNRGYGSDAELARRLAILRVVAMSPGVTKDQIMTRAKLARTAMILGTDMLTEEGLIENSPGKPRRGKGPGKPPSRYKITALGVEYLRNSGIVTR